jgi:hypothetical protein
VQVRRVTDLPGHDEERLWTFATAADPRKDWSTDSLAVARAIAC